ncbi:hypothetical protein AKJ51_00450 [candidate division MSBL1 archaeon SCGC-AAA382A20]|uniref:HTH asnC-type domain-containing protein n=1 Tax=candidate division MSBL1 archaeon SCGC-AAA382A20 TaxID=1698280 RepID=A0A133VMI0_9EURY|nr:hypothetical protein AKJ51_00450 [candidate division MSBL1 archaeon SCGC-AAA382A20]
MSELDNTDRKILSLISSHENLSYSDLATKVGISRNTAYRRVKNLKDIGVIKEGFVNNTSVDVSEFEKIGISSLLIAMNFDIENLDKASTFLKERKEVKLLLEAYGEFDIIVLLFVEKGKEREIVADLREDLREENISLIDFKVYSTTLEKLDLTLPL